MVKSCCRSFKVQSHVDCCADAWGLATGLSDITFALARADVTQNHPWRYEIKAGKTSKDVQPVADVMHAWIRDRCEQMESMPVVEGRLRTHEFKTGKQTGDVWWKEYEASFEDIEEPIVGCKSTFLKCFKEHNEILQRKLSGHGDCNVCYALSIAIAESSGVCACLPSDHCSHPRSHIKPSHVQQTPSCNSTFCRMRRRGWRRKASSTRTLILELETIFETLSMLPRSILNMWSATTPTPLRIQDLNCRA